MAIKTMLTAAAAVAMLVGADGARADDFPSKPITMMVGYGAGGMTDYSFRVLQPKLEEILGVDVLVENHPGAGGTRVLGLIQNKPADGYSVASYGSGPYVTSILIDRAGLGLDEFKFVGSYMPQSRVLFAKKDLPFSDFDGFVAYAKENQVTFANGGNRWAAAVVEAFGKKMGLNLTFVPYESGAAGSAAILGGHVDMAETGVGTGAWLGATREGTLNIIASLSDSDLSDVGQPGNVSIADKGADFTVNNLYGMAVQAGVPDERVAILEAALKEAMMDPKVIEGFKTRDLVPEFVPGAEYADMLKDLDVQSKALRDFLAGSS